MSTTRSKTNRSRTALPAVVGTYTLAEATEAVRDLDKRYELIPERHRGTLNRQLGEIQVAAERLDHHTLGDLVGDGAAFLTAVTGVKNPTAFLKTTDAEAVHPIRNLLLTLCLASAMSLRSDPQEMYRAVTALKTRTAYDKRPLCDDEIVLLRTASILEMHTSTSRRRCIGYALNDAGFTPVETTKTTLNDFENEDEDVPTHVLAAGHGKVDARYLNLDAYGRRLLAVCLRPLYTEHPTDVPFLFKPRPGAKKTKNPEGSASATSTIAMTKFLTDLGLKHADVTASSIRAWRVAHTYLTHGAEQALEVAGIIPRWVCDGTNKRLDLTRLLKIIGPALPQEPPVDEKSRKRYDFTQPMAA